MEREGRRKGTISGSMLSSTAAVRHSPASWWLWDQSWEGGADESHTCFDHQPYTEITRCNSASYIMKLPLASSSQPLPPPMFLPLTFLPSTSPTSFPPFSPPSPILLHPHHSPPSLPPSTLTPLSSPPPRQWELSSYEDSPQTWQTASHEWRILDVLYQHQWSWYIGQPACSYITQQDYQFITRLTHEMYASQWEALQLPPV